MGGAGVAQKQVVPFVASRAGLKQDLRQAGLGFDPDAGKGINKPLLEMRVDDLIFNPAGRKVCFMQLVAGDQCPVGVEKMV